MKRCLPTWEVIFAAVFLLFTCHSAPLLAEMLSGRVIRVYDGDTIAVQTDSRQVVKVRLFGIDAPEHNQRFGKEASKALTKLANSKKVVVDVQNLDQYGRTVGKVFCADADLGLQMISCGLAWHYKYYYDNQAYADAEKTARKARRGLWHDADPLPPWNFRKAERKSSSATSKGAKNK